MQFGVVSGVSRGMGLLHRGWIEGEATVLGVNLGHIIPMGICFAGMWKCVNQSSCCLRW